MDKTWKATQREQEKQSRLQAEEERECCIFFRKTQYEAFKDRNPDRVTGTCEWFLKHQGFINWRDEQQSSLLWLTADPGCGKSVLSKTLVDERLLSVDPKTAAICYFFFKDDNIDQRSGTNALSALLHQLFFQKPALIKHALPDFRQNKNRLSNLFGSMWTILERAAADSNAGEIICILDALDECEETGRINLIKTLKEFYSSCTKSNMRLKFLVTSRPYYDIELEFRSLTEAMPTIRLAGEDATEAITQEIDLVINARISKLAYFPDLSPDTLEFLKQHLLGMSNRTYLWLYLILECILSTLPLSSKGLRSLVESLPANVCDAYEAILGKIKNKDRERAVKLLHIVVVAKRPLSLRETNVALSIEEGMQTYEDLDLEDDRLFRITVRNLCGLFVRIIDSKVYLIHQTAKEFLISKEEDALRPASGTHPFRFEWKNSLEPRESNFLMARICILYLLFAVFENHPLVIDPGICGPDMQKHVEQYTTRHVFLDYAAQNWAYHLREARIHEKAPLLKSALEICFTPSKRFLTWFQVYWITVNINVQCPQGFTDVIVTSYFGLDAVVCLLLAKGANVTAKDSDGRTALHWAASGGHKAVVQLLLENGVDAAAKDCYGGTALHRAASDGHEAVVRLLLNERVDARAEDDFGRTALHLAASGGPRGSGAATTRNRSRRQGEGKLWMDGAALGGLWRS